MGDFEQVNLTREDEGGEGEEEKFNSMVLSLVFLKRERFG